MPLVFDLFPRQFYYQLHPRYRPHITHQVLQKLTTHHISLQQPQIIQVFELGQQILPIKLIIIQKMTQATIRLLILVYTEIVIPIFLKQLYLYLIIHPEIKPQQMIQMPTELIILHRRYQSEELRLFKEVIRQVFQIKF